MATELELAQMHVASQFECDGRGRIARVREPEDEPQPPPRFYLVRTAEGPLARVGATVPDALADGLLALAAGEPALGDPPEPLPRHRAEYVRALRGHAPLVNEQAGPAFVLPSGIPPPGGAVRITADNQGLLGRHFAWAGERIDQRLPIWVAVEDGAAVSICHCARLPAPAIEAGVETIDTYRRSGYGTRVVAAWANEQASRGVVPLYSTSWDNAASRRIATGLGGRMYGVTYSLR